MQLKSNINTKICRIYKKYCNKNPFFKYKYFVPTIAIGHIKLGKCNLFMSLKIVNVWHVSLLDG